MSEIFIHNKKIDSIFQLLGEKENDISFSVGWALANAHKFLDVFLEETIEWKEKYNPDDIKISLQRHEDNKGFTDFEIEYAGYFHLIIEAKRGWNFPTSDQLEKYAKRNSFLKSSAKIKKILVLSESSVDYASAHFNIKSVCDFDVEYISWRDIYCFSKKAGIKCSHAEKRLLIELNKYLENIMTMQKNDSNLVYVAPLSRQLPVDGATINNIDIVNKKLRYWHPVGGGYPKEPPNYIAFRYNGELQSIHHVESYEVFTNPHTIIKEVPSIEWDRPHFAYKLGKGFKPVNVVKTGKIFPSGKNWVMLDTLFTCKTISEARDVSQKRLKL
ncbi:MAG: hypothetical protein WC415_03320 [Patescibacteria group bacterium]|jgi:hypothetical protein